jgi:hypothetical protein
MTFSHMLTIFTIINMTEKVSDSKLADMGSTLRDTSAIFASSHSVSYLVEKSSDYAQGSGNVVGSTWWT